MKIAKAVVLSTVLLSLVITPCSSIACEMYEGAKEKTYNPRSRLTTLSNIVLAKNPTVIPKDFKVVANICLNNVTEILRDPNITLFHKEEPVTIWKEIASTNESISQIDSVGKALNKMSKEIENTRKRVDKKEVVLDQAKQMELQLLSSEGPPMYKVVDGLIFHAVIDKFDSNLAQFVRENCRNDIINQNSRNMVNAITLSTEPFKAIQFLLENGYTGSDEVLDLAKKRYRVEEKKYGYACSLLKHYEKKQKKYAINPHHYFRCVSLIGNSWKEVTDKQQEARNKKFLEYRDKQHKVESKHKEKLKKKIEAYNKKNEIKETIEVLEKAKQEEIYSDIPKLFEQN